MGLFHGRLFCSCRSSSPTRFRRLLAACRPSAIFAGPSALPVFSSQQLRNTECLRHCSGMEDEPLRQYPASCSNVEGVAFRARGCLSFELDDQIFVERARTPRSESM